MHERVSAEGISDETLRLESPGSRPDPLMTESERWLFHFRNFSPRPIPRIIVQPFQIELKSKVGPGHSLRSHSRPLATAPAPTMPITFWQAVVPLTATVISNISVAVVVAITAARVKVRQAKGRRRPRTPANMSAVPVLSSSRAVAVVRVRGARQCDNRGYDDKSCGSQCNPHGSRSLAYIFSIAEYRLCCPERT